VEVVDVRPGDRGFEAVARLAASVLEQDRYLTREYPHAIESHVLGAFRDDTPVGFLRFLVQVIGAEEDRSPVLHKGVALTEAYVEAFGVDPSARRRGIGSALQERAIEHARSAGCHQMRSRSPVTSTENYALKVGAGYVMSPSEQNDSYYFLPKL
jgi:GNAT superfamily N-acetyltransferase